MNKHREALREAFAGEVNAHESEILDVRVDWDTGDRYDPDQEYEHTTPTLDIFIVVRDLVTGEIEDRRLDTATALRALFRMVLGLDQ